VNVTQDWSIFIELGMKMVLLAFLLVKVKLPLCYIVTENHAIKAYWGVEVQFHAFFDSALHGSEWSASRSGRFTPGERAPGTQVGPRAILDAVVKRKIPSSRRESNPRTSIDFLLAPYFSTVSSSTTGVK
jgi:hypothetical protein